MSDLYKEIQIILADCLFCLATQQPLGKADTLRLIQHLRADNSMSADGSLEPVSLCLLMTLLYCFDVTLLDQEDSRGQSLITQVCYVEKGTQLLIKCNWNCCWSEDIFENVLSMCTYSAVSSVLIEDQFLRTFSLLFNKSTNIHNIC